MIPAIIAIHLDHDEHDHDDDHDDHDDDHDDHDDDHDDTLMMSYRLDSRD